MCPWPTSRSAVSSLVGKHLSWPPYIELGRVDGFRVGELGGEVGDVATRRSGRTLVQPSHLAAGNDHEMTFALNQIEKGGNRQSPDVSIRAMMKQSSIDTERLLENPEGSTVAMDP